MAKVATKSTKGSTSTANKSNSGKSNGFEFTVVFTRKYASYDPKLNKFASRFGFTTTTKLTAKQIQTIKDIQGGFFKATDKGLPTFTAIRPYGLECVWAVSDCGKYIDERPSDSRLRWEELRDLDKRTPAQEKEFKSLAGEELK